MSLEPVSELAYSVAELCEFIYSMFLIGEKVEID